MIKNEYGNNSGNICNFKYLTELMNGKKKSIEDILGVFLAEIPEALQSINSAFAKTDFESLKKMAHTMRSSVSIMGISVLTPILQEMENLGKEADSASMERIGKLIQALNVFCKRAIEEVENKKLQL